MTKLSSVDDLNKIVRNMLIAESELSADFVRNGVSLHGTDLDKRIDAQVYKSIHSDDTTLIYELLSRTSSSDMSETLDDDSISYISSYAIHVILYGRSASNIARMLAARLRTDKCGWDAWNEGIYIEEVTDPTDLNEFVNNTMLMRSDIDINISCEMSISQVSTYQPYQNVDTTVISDEK